MDVLLEHSDLCRDCGEPHEQRLGGARSSNDLSLLLALQPDSISGCILGDASMTRPMTLTVSNDRAELLTAGGIHYPLTRIQPNVYVGGDWIKIRADLSVRPNA